MAIRDDLLSTISSQTLSCFIGRICSPPDGNFAESGKLVVDISDIDGNGTNTADYDENGTTKRVAIASWSLRSAFIAWNNPPRITYSGKVKLKGRVTMDNAQLSNVTISGGPPLQGVTTGVSVTPVPAPVPAVPVPYPGTVNGNTTTPVTIASAVGSAKIEQSIGAEIEMETENDALNIELTSQKSAQLPWCVASSNASTGDEISKETPFIEEGDYALCLAIGNSLDRLFIVDVFKGEI